MKCLLLSQYFAVSKGGEREKKTKKRVEQSNRKTGGANKLQVDDQKCSRVSFDFRHTGGKKTS